MTEQTTPETDEPEAAADEPIDVAEVADVDADAGGDDDDDDEPARDPEAQAAVDEVTAHSTTLLDSASEDPAAGEFRTPPGIPDGLDPGEPSQRG